MSKRREQEQVAHNEDLGRRRTLQRVYAALYNNVPWLAVSAICMYLPGIVLWAVFALHCKADTFKFLITIAPVEPATVDGVSNLVNTTLIALITTATFIFMLALVLAIARSVQKAGGAPNSSFPCVRNSPSSFYLYRVFNLGYNFIVFFVNLFIIFLMMGAFLWLVIAYGANLSIKGGVLDAANIGVRPQQQFDLARQNYTTVVSLYEQQLKQTPPCVRNSTWFKGINSSIAGLLKPANDNSTAGNPLLCPQSCLNLGSWATLFKLKSNCICEQEKLFQLQAHSLAVATDAGVALGGLILIYFGSCCMHTYLISEHTRAGYDYKRAKRQAARRQQQLSGATSSSDNRYGSDQGPSNGGGGSGDGPGSSRDAPTDEVTAAAAGVAGHHVIAMNGDVQQLGGLRPGGSHLQAQHYHQRSHSGSSAYDSVAKGGSESRPGSFSVVEEGRQLSGAATGMAAAAGIAAAAAAAGTAGQGWHAAHAAHASGSGHSGAAFGEASPFMVSAAALPAAAAAAGPTSSGDGSVQQRLQLQHRHHRISSGGGSGSSPLSVGSRQLQRIPSPHNASRAAAAAGTGSGRVSDWQQQQQQQQQLGIELGHVRAVSPPPISMSGAWSSHGRNDSRSSTSSIRDLLSGAVPLDSHGHVQRTGLTPTSSGSGNAAAAAALQQQQQRVAVIQEVLSPAAADGAVAAMAAGSNGTAAAVQPTHRRGSSQQSNSSSSSYDTVVCHSPRSSDVDTSGSVTQVAAAAAAAAAAPAAFLSTCSVTSRVTRRHQQQQQQQQAAGTAADGAEVAAAPIAVGATVDGEEALTGSRTGSWSKRQAHRRLPALDFTKAAPALWLAQESQQQQQQGGSVPLPLQQQQDQQQDQHQQQDQQQDQHQQQDQQQPPSAQTADERVAAGAAAAAAAGVTAAAAAAGVTAAARATAAPSRAPVRRHITLDGSSNGLAQAAAAVMPQQQQRQVQEQQLQQELSLRQELWQQQQEQRYAAPAGEQQLQQGAPAAVGQQQQQQQGGRQQLPSMETVEAMLQPSPQPIHQQQQQQQEQAEQQLQQQEDGMRDVATQEAHHPQQQQQQRTRQRLAFSLLLPPPEQQELLLKQQQHQLQLLLQQAQEEQQQQQQQQQVWQPHQRQWSTSSRGASVSLLPGASSGGSSPAYFRGQQQQQLMHHHSFSTPDVAAAAAGAGVGVGVGLGGFGSGGLTVAHVGGAAGAAGTPSKYAGAGTGVVPLLAPRGAAAGSAGGVLARTASAGAGMAAAQTPIFQQQQGQQGVGGTPALLPSSYSSSSTGGGARFAGSWSANGDDESSPGEGGGSFSSRGFAPTSVAATAAPASIGGYAASNSTAGSAGGSVFTTPQATPHGSPAPLRSGRVTPSYGLNLNLNVGAAGSNSWSQLPPLGGPGSGLTASSSYSGSANAPGFSGGLSSLAVPLGVQQQQQQGSMPTPRSLLSPLGREEVLPLQGASSGYGLLSQNPGGGGYSTPQGSGVPSGQGFGYGLGGLNPAGGAQTPGVPGSIPPIPEICSAEGMDVEATLMGPMAGGSRAAEAAAAAAGAGVQGLGQQQQDVAVESPLERRRSGYRSSMRKGLMAYDQYKHRQRYQDAVSQPLDPSSSEVSRRYRSRMPAI